jgi:signal transduction histidine kinase
MISIRRQIREADHFAPRIEALRNAHLALTAVLPKATLPANAELAAHCKETLDRAALAVNYETSAKDLDQVGKVAVTQFGAICRSNTEAIEQRDAALKEVAGTVAEVINGFKGHGERHNSKMENIAVEFESLSRLEDVNEIRRCLHEDVARLKDSVQEMRRESEQSVHHFESLIGSFQQRLEMARQDSRLDHLAGLGNRRDAEQELRLIVKRHSSVCVLLFDIEGFREINRANGTPFGDKLLQALAHAPSNCFPEKDSHLEAGLARHEIKVEREFDILPTMVADKHQILQILLNLLRNAKQAIKQADGKGEKVIRVSIRRLNKSRVSLAVEDSGVGLPPENLTRIFGHGFTTKADGHGFGLHSCALAASQMGGSLRAESEGVGRGATFILELPLRTGQEIEKSLT